MLQRFGIFIFSIACFFCTSLHAKQDKLQKNNQTSFLQDSIAMLCTMADDTVDYEPELAIKYVDQAVKLSHELNYYDLLPLCNKLHGEALVNQENFNEAIKHLEEALDAFDEKKASQYLGEVYYLLGISHYYLGNYDEGLVNYQAATEYFQANNKKKELAHTFQNMGLIHGSLDDYQTSEKYYLKALSICREEKDTLNIAGLLQNIGIIHYFNKHDSLAKAYYLESLEMFNHIGDLDGIGSTYSNLGLIDLRNKRNKAAYENFENALEQFEAINYKLGKMWALHNMGIALLNMGYMNQAEEYFLQSLEVSKNLDSAEGFLENYSWLAQFYEAVEKYDKALEFHKEYTYIKDSISSSETKARIAELEALYKFESTEKELAQFQKEITRQKTHKQAILSILSIVALAAIVIFYLYRQKTQAEKKLEVLFHEQSRELKHEISERKVAEESDKLKSAFLANMSHELRTPMNAIIAFSNFLREPKLDDNKRMDYLNHIAAAGDSLLSLIDDIIDIAKIEAEELKIFIQPTNINRLMLEVHRLYKEIQKKKNKQNLEFSLIGNHEYNYIINTDPNRLKQILCNLIDNAFKYTDKGKINISFEVRHDSISFSVQDTGVGIPKEKQSQIFDRFYQLNKRVDSRGSGTGLGLAICKNLSKLLGGDIKVISELGKGSNFIVDLPADQIKKQLNPSYQAPAIKQSGLKTDFVWPNSTILIAEDEDLNFKVLDTCLSKTKAEIIRAKDGITAVQVCKERKIDLVLMDIQMPLMDGYEATEKIKELNNRTPIIAQTSFAMAGEKERCLEAGCDDFLTKPLDLTKLLEKIHHYLG